MNLEMKKTIGHAAFSSPLCDLCVMCVCVSVYDFYFAPEINEHIRHVVAIKTIIITFKLIYPCNVYTILYFYDVLHQLYMYIQRYRQTLIIIIIILFGLTLRCNDDDEKKKIK